MMFRLGEVLGRMVWEIEMMPSSEFDEWVEYLGTLKPEYERKAADRAKRKSKGRR